jgi:hypothetical protein
MASIYMVLVAALLRAAIHDWLGDDTSHPSGIHFNPIHHSSNAVFA